MTSITGQQHTALLAETYYKAVRPDGTDFYSGRVLWDRVGEIVRHPAPGTEDARGYLSVSVSPTDCTGMKWPCRLFEVEPVEDFLVWEPTPSLPSNRASHAWRVVRELPAHEALGPNGVEVAAFLELLPTLTRTQWSAAWDAAWDAAWVAARGAARDAAWVAARDAAWDAAWDAAGALVVRDLISTDHFDVLTAPMRAVGIDFDALGGGPKVIDPLAYGEGLGGAEAQAREEEEADTIEAEDAPALWRDSEDWMRDGSIHLELVDAPYMAVAINPAWIESGTSLMVEDAHEMVAILPEHLPALIAMLTEVQRRIEAEAAL